MLKNTNHCSKYFLIHLSLIQEINNFKRPKITPPDENSALTANFVRACCRVTVDVCLDWIKHLRIIEIEDILARKQIFIK